MDLEELVRSQDEALQEIARCLKRQTQIFDELVRVSEELAAAAVTEMREMAATQQMKQ